MTKEWWVEHWPIVLWTAIFSLPVVVIVLLGLWGWWHHQVDPVYERARACVDACGPVWVDEDANEEPSREDLDVQVWCPDYQGSIVALTSKWDCYWEERIRLRKDPAIARVVDIPTREGASVRYLRCANVCVAPLRARATQRFLDYLERRERKVDR